MNAGRGVLRPAHEPREVPYIDSLTATHAVGRRKKRRFARAKKEADDGVPPDTPAAPAPTPLEQPGWSRPSSLVLICAIVGFLLGSVDNLTLPTITANRGARAWATYNALIPGRPTSRRCLATCPA